MCYAEIRYHSNDFQFMQIMSEVLNVTKSQLKFWKEERLQNMQQEESKSGLYTYEYRPSQKTQQRQIIAVDEQMGRNMFSQMIGDKIIGKIFNDNLRDFKSEQDMEPILNICSIITKILIILKELEVKQRA